VNEAFFKEKQKKQAWFTLITLKQYSLKWLFFIIIFVYYFRICTITEVRIRLLREKGGICR
jgi:hypothetical protein